MTPWTSIDCNAREKLYVAQLMDVAMRRASVIMNGVLMPKGRSSEHRAVQKALLDTGAMGASFVGASWVQEHSHLILKRERAYQKALRSH